MVEIVPRFAGLICHVTAWLVEPDTVAVNCWVCPGASVGTLGYVLHGAVDWRLAAIVGIPELAGVLIGWRIAHALPTKTLKAALVAVLVGIAPYLALHG